MLSTEGFGKQSADGFLKLSWVHCVTEHVPFIPLFQKSHPLDAEVSFCA